MDNRCIVWQNGPATRDTNPIVQAMAGGIDATDGWRISCRNGRYLNACEAGKGRLSRSSSASDTGSASNVDLFLAGEGHVLGSAWSVRGLANTRPRRLPIHRMAVRRALVPRRCAPCSRSRERSRIPPWNTLFRKRHEYSAFDVECV